MKRILGAIAVAFATSLPAQASEPSVLPASQALTQAPTVMFRGAPVIAADTPTARAAANRIAPSIPLPPGGSFDALEWRNADHLTAADIQSVLEYQAACQWLRHALDGHAGDPTVDTVLSQIPAWPTFRDGDRGTLLRRAATNAATARDVVAQCAV